MTERLTVAEAAAHVHGIAFKIGPPARVGLELEWLVHDAGDPGRPVAARRVLRAVSGLAGPGALPGGSALSREPGGQLELSTPPGPLAAALAGARADRAVLDRALAAEGLSLCGRGLEPRLDPPRVLEDPRYAAMEGYFDRIGAWGRRMMRATAGLQINLDAGDEGPGHTHWRRRWRLAHRLGPVLVAAFANSPLWHGVPTGWRSTRQALWSRLDPSRTQAPAHAARARPGPDPAHGEDGDPRDLWARYALDAGLLCVRRPGPQGWDAPAGLTFRDWVEDPPPGLDPPTLADLDYHLTTLFPPVRPRGWLELRMIDAQPGEGWVVAAAVATALLDDPVAAKAAWAATEPLCPEPDGTPSAWLWARAARCGPSAPELGQAALDCFTAALGALDGGAAPPGVHAAVADFTERYVARGRCPADDDLDALPGGASPRVLEEIRE